MQRTHLGGIYAHLLLDHGTGIGAADAKFHLGRVQTPLLSIDSGRGVTGLLAQRSLTADRIFDVCE